MNTRSSPSLTVLHSLARQANMQESHFRRLSKPALFQRLRETTNFARLERARARALKATGGAGAGAGAAPASGAAAAVAASFEEDEDEDDDYYECHSSEEDAIAATAMDVARGASGGGRLTRSTAAAAAAAASAAAASDALRATKQARGGWGGKGKGKKAAAASLNTHDPIFGTPLSQHTFRFTRPNGTAVLYDVESLVDYLLATGAFHEPETRLSFSDADLRQLDALARAAGLAKPSVHEARHAKSGVYTEMRFRRDALMGLERCAGELVAEMLQLVERTTAAVASGASAAAAAAATASADDESDPVEEAEMRLVLTLFPLFADLYKQIEAADKEWAAQCMAHFADYLRGPPNRRTRDPHGLLRSILSYLEDLRAE